ncbi:sulfate ABC transporter permease subunit CysT [Rhodococcus sp. D2-41]|uniref:Sulfate transport system permease protein CysT n=1 Tax=Speluncibacter jeojiensis TaxID=2710754 RepID=A0A9X4LY07_9ACTN|nr:sulfate ABC transporter permease subunit CysT [Rhodococcus sp. D2-41]MDG3011825.1 sulfate ABC transporter permease subunit CysT [Rhodococcus sp. D2-41]MDG3013277.1 sulfate ABC transporter permease subunit CysT [Corynebacteriales bacterium D3-21]
MTDDPTADGDVDGAVETTAAAEKPGRPRSAASAKPRPPRRRLRAVRRRGRGVPGPAAVGVASIWLSVIVLLPLAAIAVESGKNGFGGFWDAVTAPSAVAAFEVTIVTSLAVTAINAVMGTLVAWVLVRDEFPGKRFVNAFIDLPFALPTIVASIVLLALYGPDSPIGIHVQHTKIGLAIALLFVTLPFVVRAVQPVLIELDRDVEEAAASLGAGNLVIFRRIVLPALIPAVASGAGLAFSRAIGEFGSVILIGGGIPRDTEVASQYIKSLIEQDSPVAAASISVVLLAISFTMLLVLRILGSRAARREELDR